MSSRGTNKILMRRVFEEMWNQGKPDAAHELFDRPEGVEKFVSGFLTSFPDLNHIVEAIIEEDDFVAVKFSASGTHSGAWLEIPPTGKSIRYTGITWARISGGMIRAHRTEWDKAGLVDQLKA